jgi:hypothetical protein
MSGTERQERKGIEADVAELKALLLEASPQERKEFFADWIDSIQSFEKPKLRKFLERLGRALEREVSDPGEDLNPERLQ